MKVFVSWSGDRSKVFASQFGPWLQDVLQNLTPFVSADDIDKGARWASVINRELSEAGFGIVCLTSDTITSPWINFEAGALSRRFADSDNDPPVATLLLDDDNPGAIPQPLAQFNGSVATKDDIFKLLKSLNAAMGGEQGEGVDSDRLSRTFEQNWATLEQAINKLRETDAPTPAPPSDPVDLMPAKVDEVLSILREMNRTGVVPHLRNALPESAKRGFMTRVDDIFHRLMPGVEPYVVWSAENDRAPLILSTRSVGENVVEAVRAAGARHEIIPGFKIVNPGDTVVMEGGSVSIGTGPRYREVFHGPGLLKAGAPAQTRPTLQELATSVTEAVLLRLGLDASSMHVLEADKGSVEIYVPHSLHNSVLQNVRDAVKAAAAVEEVRFVTRGDNLEMDTLDPDNPGAP